MIKKRRANKQTWRLQSIYGPNRRDLISLRLNKQTINARPAMRILLEGSLLGAPTVGPTFKMSIGPRRTGAA
jgi:hypothetical protein